jgi:hypothetical protein
MMFSMKTTANEIVAKFNTTDGINVVIWSDGLVTGRLGDRTCMVRLPLNLIADAPATLACFSWAQIPGVIRAIKKSGKLPISPERSAELAASNSADRMRALRIEIEHNRNPWAR